MTEVQGHVVGHQIESYMTTERDITIKAYRKKKEQ